MFDKVTSVAIFFAVVICLSMIFHYAIKSVRRHLDKREVEAMCKRIEAVVKSLRYISEIDSQLFVISSRDGASEILTAEFVHYWQGSQNIIPLAEPFLSQIATRHAHNQPGWNVFAKFMQTRFSKIYAFKDTHPTNYVRYYILAPYRGQAVGVTFRALET